MKNYPKCKSMASDLVGIAHVFDKAAAVYL